MKYSTIFLLFSLIFIGCKDDVDEFEPYVKTAISFPEVVDLKPIYAQFNAEEMSEIDLGEGNILVIHPNSIVDKAGHTLAGKIDLSITRIQKKSDLVYAYMNSNDGQSDNGLLDNYHIINIKGYHNSKEVFIKDNQQIILKSPTDASVFDGFVWSGKYFTSNDFGWEKAPNTSVIMDSWNSNGTSYDGISYTSSTFGWISGAEKLSNSGHSLCVNLIEGLDAKKTKVYFIFDDAFSVAELKIFSDTQRFCGTIPSGSKGHLIIINEEEKGKYRYQKETLTISENTDISAQPPVRVLEDIILDLNSL